LTSDIPNPAELVQTADFAALVREHQSMVFSLALHFLHDRASAEELAQDVFLQLYRHLGELKSPEHVVYWLRRVTVNRCISESRRRQRRPEVPLEDAPEPEAPKSESDPLAGERLRRMVASLPEKIRMVVLLRYQEDLDPEDIAKLLAMSVNTVKSQLQRALVMLRRKASGMELER
jgi:RNA polymerase sigma-70 factor, ECF subfamily